VKFVLCESRRISERLTDIFLFELRQVFNDLRWRHSVGKEVNDMRYGNAETTDGRSAREHVRVSRNAIEGVRHSLSLSPF
jgi:hypothetical protein